MKKLVLLALVGVMLLGASVFAQIIDPDAFAGREAFIDQMQHFVAACHANSPVDPDRPVRLPGEQANRNIAEAEALGLPLAPDIREKLKGWAQRLGVRAHPF